MKKDSELIQKDFSFLQKMSTEELQEILRRDMDLDEDESDMDLILNVMEVLDARENESESEQDTERALIKLRKLINRRDVMFAKDIYAGKDNSAYTKSSRNKLLWLRIGSIAAIVVLVISISFTAANAKGYDLWGGMVHWTRETFSFGEKTESHNNSNSFAELKAALDNNDISIPVIPTWLPEEYSCEDVQVFNTPKDTRIVAFAVSQNDNLSIQIISSQDTDFMQYFEKKDGSVWQYESNGIVHYIMKNGDYTTITWASEKVLVSFEFSSTDFDVKRLIDSIYLE